MSYSYLLHVYTRTALAVARSFSPRQFSAAATLVVALALGAGLLAGSSVVYAQEGAALPAVNTVNINSADAAALAAGLKGVGQSRAMDIVRYREAYGPFSSIEELAEVKGIGKSTLDNNRAVITLD